MADFEFPETLFERVRAGTCILCTGVRFAAAAGMPTWEAMLSQMSSKLGEDKTVARLVAEGKFLTVAGYLKRKLGEDSITGILQEAYGRPTSTVPEVYKILGEIPFRAAITTGYDTLLERALANGSGPPRVYTYADGAVLRLSEDLKHYVVKAHGDVAHPAPLVLDRLDYKRVIAPNQAYRAFVEDLYRTNTMLIVGFHPGDPDFVLFLERLVATFRDAVTDHYALLPGLSLPEQEELYANYRVRVIPYDTGEDAVAALATALRKLREQWGKHRTTLPVANDPQQQIQWLREQLVSVDIRIDVVAQEGLGLPEGRLDSIRTLEVVSGEGVPLLTDGKLDTIRTGAANVKLPDLDPQTLCRLGNVSLTFDDAARAAECYNAALAKDATLAAAHLNLHHALAELHRFDESLTHLKQAIALDSALRSVPARFELTSVFGRGTTGTIYFARDAEARRDVTVKVLRASYVREHVSPQRWLKETEQLKKLDHPNLAKVYDAVLDGGRCILVTEALSGRSLAALLRAEGHLPVEKAAQLLGEACQGIAHAHAQGIVHLDLTPSNIFLRDDGRVAVMDFRTGRAYKGRHVTEKGAEGYQAPEILAGAGGDARSDVYSLGAILYTMLTGKVPLGSFARLAELAPQARRFDPLVTRAMRALPNERPSTVEEFAKALSASTEDVTLPEREDDLEGWLEVLSFQPDNVRARAVLAQLEKTYREGKSWDGLVALLLGRVESELETEAREKLLREVALIFEREVGDLGKAFAALSAAFRENSTSVEIRKELERLAGATGMWNELLHEYTQLVQNLRDPKVACDWWVRMGHLYAAELGHDDYALASFQQALALDANRADALAELTEVLKRKGMHKEYARALGRLADLETDAARRVELYKELARTHVKELKSDEEAILTWRKVLEIDTNNAAAVQALEGLYRKNEMWQELAQLLRDRIEIVELAEDQQAFRRTLAGVLAEKLSQPEPAIAQYQKLLEGDPDDTAALKALERLFEQTGRGQDYLKILDKRLAAAQGAEEKVALCRRMAAEWEEQDGGKAKAAEYFEKIVKLSGGDEQTFKSLVRLYWAIGDHARLAEAYHRHIQIAQSPADRAVLYGALGKVCEEHLKDDGRATEAFNNLLKVEPDSKIALTALARIYQKTSVFGQAVQMLQTLATKEENVDKQVEIFHRIGVLQAEHLKKDADAEVSLAKALELKDNHVESMLVLADLYRRRKDFGKAAAKLREAGRATANPLDKVKRLHLAALTYQDDLGNAEKAREVYEELLVLDPEHVATGDRLAAIDEQVAAWAALEPVLEMLVRKADHRDRGRLVDLNLRLGRAARELGHEEKAVPAFRAAYDLDPTNQLALRALADLLYKRGAYEEAGKLFQALLVHRRDAMAPADIVEVFATLGDIKEKLGEKPKALNMFEKALDVDPTSARVLQHAIRLYEEKGDQEAVLRCTKNLLKGAEGEDARLKLAEDLGDLLHEKMKRGSEAITYYKMIIEVKPDHRRVLNKILEVYIEQKKWDDAITAMGKIEDHETDPNHRARLHYTAAVIFRDELKRPNDAAWHLDQALVKDPTHRKAFDALKVLYTKQLNWKGLAKAYRLMLQRLPEATPREEQMQLWQELGEICQDKLHDYKEAIIALEVAAKLDPKDEARQDNLALLYTSAGPDAYEKAIIAHHRLLRNNPLRLETYQELRRLYGEMKEHDKEWCVAAVLAVLGKGSEAEAKLYRAHRSEQPRRVGRKLSDELWRDHLNHVFQFRTLNQVFATALPVVAPMAVKSRRVWGLKPEERLDPAADKRAYAKSAAYVGQVLDLAPQELYVRGGMTEQASAIVAGEPSDMARVLWLSPKLVAATAETELHFWLTRVIAMLRPEHALCFITPSATVLRAVALACLKVVQPALRVGGDAEDVLKLADALKHDLPPAKLDALAELGQDLRDASDEGRLEKWMKGVDLSVTRAALLLCDDLETAARLISAEPAQGMDAKERLRELMLYAVSEQYFKLREIMGLKLK